MLDGEGNNNLNNPVSNNGNPDESEEQYEDDGNNSQRPGKNLPILYFYLHYLITQTLNYIDEREPMLYVDVNLGSSGS
jgi:hypothetical protein